MSIINLIIRNECQIWEHVSEQLPRLSFIKNATVIFNGWRTVYLDVGDPAHILENEFQDLTGIGSVSAHLLLKLLYDSVLQDKTSIKHCLMVHGDRLSDALPHIVFLFLVKITV